MKYAKRIKEARNHADLTQKELAEKLGVVRETVGGYETGRYNPTLEMLEAIARATGVPFWFLVDESLSSSERVRRAAGDLSEVGRDLQVMERLCAHIAGVDPVSDLTEFAEILDRGIVKRWGPTRALQAFVSSARDSVAITAVVKFFKMEDSALKPGPSKKSTSSAQPLRFVETHEVEGFGRIENPEPDDGAESASDAL